jgi:hypothetical protein
VANGKQRKTRIFISEQDEVLISGEANLKKYITKYYKSLFGAPEPSFCDNGWDSYRRHSSSDNFGK